MKRNHRKYWRRHNEDPSPEWVRRRRFLFIRFFLLFGIGTVMILLGVILGGLTLLHGIRGEAVETPIWILTCSAGVLLPFAGWGVAVHAFDEIAQPLTEIMRASQSISEGDLSVRVELVGQGEFRRVLETYNMMVIELQRIETQRRNLTADVAHELRNPLHIIQGNLEGILDGVYKPTNTHIQSILDETHILNHLIDDLRTLSMAESGQLLLNKKPTNIADLLGDIASGFRPQIESANLMLKLHTETVTQIAISIDSIRMNQVLGNLLINAIRHTPSGGVITISAYKTRNHIEIGIHDTGKGISDDHLPHIFDRFWRGDNARTRIEGVGGGLGLAIARQLIELHDGTIHVESKIGKGTHFIIQLPFPETPKNIFNPLLKL